MLVHPDRPHQVELRAQVNDAVQVPAQLLDIVVRLVGAVDGAAGAGVGIDVIGAVENGGPRREQIEAVLELPRPYPGAVLDGIAVPEQKGAAGIAEVA